MIGPVAPVLNRITSSRLHVPPFGFGAIASACADPPSTSIRFSAPSAKNPTDRLSGDQNGSRAFSVPGNGRADVASSARSHNWDPPSDAATKASLRPSGEIASDTVRRRRRADLDAHFGSRRRGTERPHERPDTNRQCERRGHPCEPLARPRCARRLRSRGRRGLVDRATEQVLDLHARLADRLQPSSRILLQTAAQQPAQSDRRLSRHRLPVRFRLQHRGEHVGDRLALERPPPVSISKSTHPNAQTSARLSTGLPRACSGDMYAAVPRMIPAACVIAGVVMVGDCDTFGARPRAPSLSRARSPALSPCRRRAP